MNSALLTQVLALDPALHQAFINIENHVIAANKPLGQTNAQYIASLDFGLQAYLDFYNDPNLKYLVNGYIQALSGYLQVREAYPEAVPALIIQDNTPQALLDQGGFVNTIKNAPLSSWIDTSGTVGGIILKNHFDEFVVQTKGAAGVLAKFSNKLHAKTAALLTWQTFEELDINQDFDNDNIREFIFNDLGWAAYLNQRGLHQQGIYSFPRDSDFSVAVLEPADIPLDDPAFDPTAFIQYITTGDVPFFVRDAHFDLLFQPSTSGYMSWAAGSVSFMSDTNQYVKFNISAGDATYAGSTIFVCYIPGVEDLFVTTNPQAAYINGQSIVAIYEGAFKLRVFRSTRIILGSEVAVNSMPPDRIGSGDLKSIVRIGSTGELFLNGAVGKIGLGNVRNPRVVIGPHTESGYSSQDGWLFRDSTGKVFMDSIRGLGQKVVGSENIKAGAVQEHHLYFGARSIEEQGINLTIDAENDRILWTSGVISWFDDNGNNILTSIIAGQAVYSGTTLFVLWERGADRFTVTTDTNLVYDTDNFYIFAQYSGDNQLARNFQSTQIDGARIRTGTVEANRLASDSIFTQLLFLGSNRFSLDGPSRNIRVKDENDLTRVLLGRTQPGDPQGYGIQIFNSSGSLILGANGLGVDVVGASQVISGSLPFNVLQADSVLTRTLLVGDDQSIILDGSNSNLRVQDQLDADRVILGKIMDGQTVSYGMRIFDDQGEVYFDVTNESTYFVHDESIRTSLKYIGAFLEEPDPDANTINATYKNITTGATYVNQYVSGNSGPKQWVLYTASPNTTGFAIINTSTIGYIFSDSGETLPINSSITVSVRYDGFELAPSASSISARRQSDNSLISLTLSNIVAEDNLKPSPDGNGNVHYGLFQFVLNFSNFIVSDFPVKLQIADAGATDSITLYRIVGSTFKVVNIETDSFFFLFADDVATVPENTSITFTVAHQNTATKVTSSDISIKDANDVVYAFSNFVESPTADGVATFQLTWATVSAAVFPLRVQVTKENLSDLLTIQKFVGGSDSIGAYLTNESHTVYADAIGVVPTGGLDTAIGRFEIFQGFASVNESTTFSVESQVGCTASIDSSGLATSGNYSIDTLTSNQAQVTFKGVYNGVTVRKVMSITKTIAGAAGAAGVNGTNGLTISATNENHTFPADKDGILTGTAQFSDGNSNFKVFLGTTELSYDAGGSQNTFRFGTIISSNVTRNTGLAAPIVGIQAMAQDNGSLTVPVIVNVGGNVVNIDKIIRYARVRRGADGAPGAPGVKGDPGDAGAPGVDGADGKDGRTVNLEASTQNIKYNASGASPDAANVTITATPVGLASTPIFVFFVDDIEVQNSVSDSFVFPVPQLFSELPVKIEVQVKEGVAPDIVARDQITIFGTQPGQDAITISQSNEAHSVIQLNTGAVNFSNSGNDITVYEGAEQVPYDANLDLVPSFRVTAATNAVTPGAASVVSTFIRRFANITAMTADVGSIDFTVQVKNSSGIVSTFIRSQTFTKSREGLKGADGINGTNGINGAAGPAGLPGVNGINGAAGIRGSKHLFRTYTGSVWSNAQANQAFIDDGSFPLIIGDQCTLYNIAASFAEQRSWNGTAWVGITRIIPGNLLVQGSVSANELAANSVIAGKIAAGAVTAANISANFGKFEDSLTVGSAGNNSDTTVIAGNRASSTHRMWVGAQTPQAAPFSIDKFGKVQARSLEIFETNGELIFSSAAGFSQYARNQALIGSGVLVNPLIRTVNNIATELVEVTLIGATEVQYRLSVPIQSQTLFSDFEDPTPPHNFGSVNVAVQRRVKGTSTFTTAFSTTLTENVHYEVVVIGEGAIDSQGNIIIFASQPGDQNFIIYQLRGKSPFVTPSGGILFPTFGAAQHRETIGVNGVNTTYEFRFLNYARGFYLHDINPGVGFIEGNDGSVGGGPVTNADTLAGQSPNYYLNWNNLINVPANVADQFTSAGLLTKLAEVHGPGSGLHADLLDGFHASAFALASHTHDYAATNHTHTQYSEVGHTHDFAATNHTHAEYAVVNHTHTQYSPINHTHGTSDISNLDSALANKLDATQFVASNILTLIKTVDGPGSGLDAEFLGGNAAAAFSLAGHTHAQYAPINNPIFTGIAKAPNQLVTDNSDRIATTNFVNLFVTDFVGEAGYATANGGILNNPTFTGVVTAPTLAITDNTTKVATTGFVHSYVEDYLGDYAPLNSPVLIGTPTAPNQPISDNSQKIATTQFVQGLVAAAAIDSGAVVLQDVLDQLQDSIGGTPTPTNFSQLLINGLT